MTFIDGLPFKPGYRRYRIKSVEGVDDFASIREVVARRFRNYRPRRREAREEYSLPTSCSSTAARASSTRPWRRSGILGVEPPVPDLAGQARGGDLPPRRGRAAAAEPPRRGAAAAAIRPRRGPPLRPALPPHAAAKEADRRQLAQRRKLNEHGAPARQLK